MLPNNITDFLSALSRRKLLREATASSGEARRDKLSLHRWTLIKNSISHASARPNTATPTHHTSSLNATSNPTVAPESVPIPDDDAGDFYEEDEDLGSVFLFPDVASVSSSATTDSSVSPPASPTDEDVRGFDFEARWLDDVLADLAADGDDDAVHSIPSDPKDPLFPQSEVSRTPVPPLSSSPPPSAPILGPTAPEPEEIITPLSLSFADVLPYGLTHLYPPLPSSTLDASLSSDDTLSDDESDDGPATPANQSQASFDTTYDMDGSSSSANGFDLFPAMSPSPRFFQCSPALFPSRF